MPLVDSQATAVSVPEPPEHLSRSSPPSRASFPESPRNTSSPSPPDNASFVSSWLGLNPAEQLSQASPIPSSSVKQPAVPLLILNPNRRRTPIRTRSSHIRILKQYPAIWKQNHLEVVTRTCWTITRHAMPFDDLAHHTRLNRTYMKMLCEHIPCA